MTQTITRFVRILSVVLLTVCTTRLVAGIPDANLVRTMTGNESVAASSWRGNDAFSLNKGGVDEILVTSAVTNPLCYNAHNGAIVLTPSGGQAPYAYVWGNGATTQNLFNIGAGTYNVTVTDANGQSAASSIVVTQPGMIVAYTNCIHICPGSCTGQATVTVVGGGTAPYTYTWSTGSTSQTITGLCAGVYWVTITDANGCKKIVAASVATTNGISLSGNTTNSGCGTPCTGTITQTVSGAQAPYTYNWSDNNAIHTKDRSALCPGTYTVTVTSANGCTATATYVIEGAPGFTVNATDVCSTSPNCFSTASVAITGGSAPYTYAWQRISPATPVLPVQTTASIQILADDFGVYSVTVTDDNGCVATDTVHVECPCAPCPDFSANIISTNGTCASPCGGTATVQVNGGPVPGTSVILWSNGASTATIENLCAGTYSVVITAATGCSATDTVVISTPGAVTVDINYQSPVCGQDSVVLTATASVGGGTFFWTALGSATVLDNDASFTATAAGTYIIHFAAANDCEDTDTVTVTFPTATSVTVVATPSGCGVTNGTATATAEAGATFLWTGGATTSSISGLAPGQYCVTVTAPNGCTASGCANVTGSDGFTIDINGVNPTCYGAHNGSATVVVTGGTAPFTYHWSTGASTSSIGNLGVGAYSVTVTDAAGCSAIDNITLTQPSPIVAYTNCLAVCPGACNSVGTVTVVSGGTPPYTYAWSNGSTGATVDSLCVGVYWVTITDANGCKKIVAASVWALPGVVVNGTVTNPLCAPVCSGSIVQTITGGGSAVYTYIWNDGATTKNRFNLCAGTYSVTATSVSGCTGTNTYTIVAPNPLDVDVDTESPLCAGANNGSASVTVTGGTAPYSYFWSNGAITPTINGLASGQYCVTVTDANGCSGTACGTVNVAPPVTVELTGDSLDCYGDNSGSVSVVVTGGTAPYTYIWTGNGTTSSASGLAAGTYCVTVTDVNNCSASGCVTIYQPSELTIVTNSTDVDCYGGTNGTVSVVANGGTAPYTYAWTGGNTTSSASGLAAGQYCVTVTDANNCTATGCVTIEQPDQVQIVVTPTNPLCYPNTGSASVAVTGGTMPYTYSWSNSATTSSISGLAAGQYCVTVTDANDCTATACVTIVVPTELEVSVQHNDIDCYGVCNGSINFGVTGGTSPYTIIWSNGATGGGELSGLCADTYSYTVTDDNGCSLTGSVVIDQPTQITIVTNATDVNCYGGTNGTVSVVASGGTSPYTYVWTGGGTDASASGLAAGQYCVTVTDANNCTATGCVTIEQPDQLVLTPNHTDATCPGLCNGTVSVGVAGGTMPYSYEWTGGNTTSSASGLCAGQYCVTVTDANDCTATVCITISEPAPVTVVVNGTNNLCPEDNTGSITVTAAGGTSPYAIVWSNAATTFTIGNLESGIYCFTVTDENGCTATGCDTLVQPDTIQVISVCPVLNLCPGECVAQIDITVLGGTAPYTYQWYTYDTAANAIIAPYATTEDLANLCSGFYYVIVTDANGCTSDKLHNIPTPAPITHDYSVFDATCYGVCNGSAVVTPGGGNGDLAILWSNGSTTWTVTGLCSGQYCYTITDGNGCTVSQCFNVDQPSQIIVDASSTSPLCYGGTGSVSVDVTGGTAPYTYLWTGGGTNSSATGLPAGTYIVVVTDDNDCTASDTVVIVNPIELVATAEATDMTCYGLENGTITVTVTGGTAPYTYAWANGATTATGTGLGAGTYMITVTDANDCTAIATATVNEPAQVTLTTDADDVNCYGGSNGSVSVVANGGTAPYTYVWTGGNTTSSASGLPAGTYCVTVTDAHDCTATACVMVEQPEMLTVVVNGVSPLCYDGSASASAVVSGGTMPYSYLWSNDATTSSISGLATGQYCVTITDGNGCTATACTTITAPSQLVVIANSTSPLCYGGTGSVSAVASGGTAPYTYLWTGGGTDASASGLGAGTYIVVVTDANDCTASDTVEITVPAPLTASANPTDVTCPGLCNGAVSLGINGGTGAYTIIWSNGMSGAEVSGLCAGTYTFTVTDANQCTYEGSVTIEAPLAIEVNAVPTNVVCYLGNSGAVSIVSITGGTSPYVVNWSTLETGLMIDSLSAGQYCFTVTDDNGCTVSSCVDITEPEPLGISTICPDTLLCPGSCNGVIIVDSIINGTAPYTYLWSNGATTSTITNACPDSLYTVTVTDANGCSADKSHILGVSEPIEANAVATDAVCYLGNTGSVTVTVTGGVAPYVVNWNTLETGLTIDSLSAGVYFFTVTDANGCSATGQATVGEPEPFGVAVSSPSICPGTGCVGVITVTGTQNGTAASYLWSNGATTVSITDACPGTQYSVTVTSTNGCTADIDAVVGTSAPVVAIASSINDSNCQDNICNGSVSVDVSGGVAPTSILWSTGATTATVGELCGTLIGGVSYSVTVTDANGCSAADTAVVLCLPPPVCIFPVNIVGETTPCVQGGSVELSVSGITTGVATYVWSSNNGSAIGTDATYTVTASGTYYLAVVVTFTDGTNCTAADTITIDFQPAPIVDATSEDVSCPGVCNGSASLDVTGVTSYSIVWSNGSTGASLSGLCAGTYCYTVTAAGGCVDSGCVVIDAPAPIVVTEDSTNVTCFNEWNGTISLTISGGTDPYTISWSNGASGADLSNLAAGLYCYTVTDVNGCSVTGCITLTEPEPITASWCANCPFEITCHDACTGELDVTVYGGTAPYTYVWNDGVTTEDRTNLCAGWYLVTITDANGCTYELATEPLENPDSLIADVSGSINDTECNDNECDGILSAVVTGGTAPYEIMWSNNGEGSIVTGVCQGTYTVTITDARGCVITRTVVINCVQNPPTDSVECNDFRTQTQGGWGTTPNGNNPAVYLYANFDAAFPGGLVIGNDSCGFTLTLTSEQAVTAFIPSGGTPAALTQNLVDPTQASYSNVLAGQLTALTLSVKFDAIDPNFSTSTASLSNQIIASGTFMGWTVGQVLAEGNLILAGCSSAYTASEINEALSAINENYVGGDMNNGFVVCPDDFNGTVVMRTEESATVTMSDNATISAYPNPFNVNSNIEFTLTNDDNVTLEVYTVTGVKVAVLYNGSVKANETNTVMLDGSNLADGMYIYRLVTTNGIYTGGLNRIK